MEKPRSLAQPMRLSAACSRCRRLKIKCDLRDDNFPCSACSHRNHECLPSRSQARAKVIARSDHLISIEERIERMESVLRDVVFDSEAPTLAKPLSHSVNEQASLEKNRALHHLKQNGETEFLGLSSGLTILSPAGFEWVSLRIGVLNTEKLMTILNFLHPSPLFFHNVHHEARSQPRHQLPPKHLARVYVDAFFDNLSSWIPFFQRNLIDAYFEKQYSDTPPSNASWYAAFNVILCFGYTSVQTCPLLFQPETSAAWGYLNNARSVVPDLMFSEGDTLGVQSILTMAIIYNSTMAFKTSSMLLSVAVRLALAQGFHRQEHISTEAGAVRRCTFWLAYILDKGMCIRFGQPPVIDDDEIGIQLPPAGTSTCEQSPPGFSDTSFLRQLVELALIQSKICKWLYSSRFRAKPAHQRLRLMDELDRLLKAWKMGIPLHFTPEYYNAGNERIDPVLNLHMQYYYTVITLHRTSLGISLQQDLEIALKRESLIQAELGAESCLAASRATMDLLNYGNGNLMVHYMTSWSILFHSLIAALVLFANTIDHPSRDEARSNIAHLQLFADMLHKSPSIHTSQMGQTLVALADLLVEITETMVAKEVAVNNVSHLGAEASTVAAVSSTDPGASEMASSRDPVLTPDSGGGSVPYIAMASTIFDFLFPFAPQNG